MSASLPMFDLDSDEYTDRLRGCWLGKNAGGTLGAPHETILADSHVPEVSWYQDIPPGGLPNDDLEMQLVWLKALEERGPHLSSQDLADYWIEHIGYNFDEYGLFKGNLRKGLHPPVAGSHDNWFTDCMGSPIRSEIWACVTPGSPRLAARYAILDSSCDHPGGEGMFAEVFNAVFEAAAFVNQNPRTLLELALSYIPASSATARAVRTAIEAHEAGLSWRGARAAVISATPHHVSQYAPVNIGFQVIGLLYGEDFGHSLTLTVSCGWDTDSSGAGLGAWLGIIRGASGLPRSWVEPLGEQIATNESWGGVRKMSTPPRPVPSTLAELIARIRAAAYTVRAAHARGPFSSTELAPPEGFAERLDIPATSLEFSGPLLDVHVQHATGPTVEPGVPHRITATLSSANGEGHRAQLALLTPEGWDDQPHVPVTITSDERTVVHWDLVPPAHLASTQQLVLAARIPGRRTPDPMPITLLAAYAFHELRCDHQLDLEDQLDDALLDQPWTAHYRPTSALDLQAGPWLYLRHTVRADSARDVWTTVNASAPIRVWVDGHLIHSATAQPIRPSLHGLEGSSFSCRLNAGDTEFLIEVDLRSGPAEGYLLFAGDDVFKDSAWDLERHHLGG